ncbi:M1 family metallopeptidase [Pontibacter sp. BT310]|uniref:M1 family metallopeptidase n=1 Tax=Pontibacter populi TaxID=890055 RepID=A0ABS6XEE2_9BACT|nr:MULTISPECIES: M1 family metallopeptidase [Pontibacter]MBJ6119471.1 M1 family metallopeptidase [Pontibacter sp. BT310]MBR0571899.1 M1 family metallopeptidase [Microvirga sp. STS03]MBW3366325.1 M1 family metallopeptidase [Pontibacter populi]
MKNLLTGLVFFGLAAAPMATMAQSNTDQSKFKQLQQELPTPNTYRSASGAPGHQYWQQRADYNIKVELNDENQSINGSETITYTNNSPDVLTYLWLQLDQNIYEPNSMANSTRTGALNDKMPLQAVEYMTREKFDGGFKIRTVKDRNGKALKYTINNTMMRIDLPSDLKPKQSFTFSIDWNHNINNQLTLGGRSGYEFFPEDGNYLYEMAQWFPRMAVYDDVNGWQHKQFLGSGEFALPFGDYKVSITVPADHIVGATGELQNASQVLTSTQQKRWAQAAKADKPVVVVTQEEATQAEKSKAKGKKTWVYSAKDVRDFAWASSRKFIWDAMNVKVAGKNVLAMSYYPKEGNPLWGKYSTQSVAHTLEVYSKHTIDYPYPVAISVHGPVGGMEYPMLSFNGYRPEPDGTYSDRTKYGLISVIIHEVGHNFFPMIINSDERQWTWMDEGLNTFMQYLSEQEWERNYPSRRGEPADIVEYMKSAKNTQVPIMTNSESVLQFGNNAYGKPATALNILRETIMGRELFDYAFKEYSQRWAFKHPMPADFFRTMEDASGVDLDWFWRGWFYTTDHTDISIEGVKWFTIDSQNPEFVSAQKRTEQNKAPQTLSQQRNLQDIKKTRVELRPELNDFYNSYDELAVTAADKQRHQSFLSGLTPKQKEMLDSGLNFYEVGFKNLGGLVMPLIVKMTYEDGTNEIVNVPAEVWRYNNEEITKVFVTEKPVVNFELDPMLQTADTDLSNNYFPRKVAPSRFEIFQQQQRNQPNPMQRQNATQNTNTNSGR